MQPDIEKRLIDATLAGAPMTLAAAHAGVSERTFVKWMERGRFEKTAREDGEPPDPGEQLFVDFHDRITQARAQAGVSSLAAIRRAAAGGAVIEETTQTLPDGTVLRTVRRQPPDWRAGAWYLERQHRVDFGKAAEVAVTGPGGGPVQVEHSVDVDALAARIFESVRALPPGSGDGNATAVDVEVLDDVGAYDR